MIEHINHRGATCAGCLDDDTCSDTGIGKGCCALALAPHGEDPVCCADVTSHSIPTKHCVDESCTNELVSFSTDCHAHFPRAGETVRVPFEIPGVKIRDRAAFDEFDRRRIVRFLERDGTAERIQKSLVALLGDGQFGGGTDLEQRKDDHEAVVLEDGQPLFTGRGEAIVYVYDVRPPSAVNPASEFHHREATADEIAAITASVTSAVAGRVA